MKNKILSMFLALIFIISLLPSSVVLAESSGTCGDSIIWEVAQSGRLLRILGWGYMYDYASSDDVPWKEWKDSIREIEFADNWGANIVNIGNNAFAGFTNLEYVDIYNELDCKDFRIGDNAFSNCDNLYEFRLVNSDDAISYIGDRAFENCRSLEISNVNADFSEMFPLSDNFSYLGAYAFANCECIASYIRIPDSLTTISEYAFADSHLETVILGENIREIKQGAFQNCANLNRIKLNGEIEEIKENAFDGCVNLSMVYYGGNHGNLSSVVIASGNENLTKNLEYDGIYNGTCGNNITWRFENNILTLSGEGKITDYTVKPWFVFFEDTAEIVINEGIEDISSSFKGFSKVNKVTISDSVTKIGMESFRECVSLENIALPAGLEIIERYAFLGCTALEEIAIPRGVAVIEGYTFSGCSGLKNISIPNTVKTIEAYAFSKCNLEKINYYGTPAEWNAIVIETGGNDGFLSAEVNYCSNTDSISLNASWLNMTVGETQKLEATVLPENATNKNVIWASYDESVATVDANGVVTAVSKGETKIKATTEDGGFVALCDVTVTEKITVVASGDCSKNKDGSALWELDSNGKLTISGNGDVYVGAIWFSVPNYMEGPWEAYRENITEIVINPGVTGIGEYAFSRCYNVKSVTIPNTVTKIGTFAFIGCSSLTSVDIPESVTSMGWINPFSGCASLREINVDSKNTNFKSVNGIIYTISGEKLIAFPNQASYSDSIFDGVKIINAGALYGNNTIENIILPETITTIEDYVFYNCGKLKNVQLNEGLTTFANSRGVAFRHCPALETVNIPSTLSYSREFMDCPNLKNVRFDGEPTASGRYVRCTSLTEFVFPDSVETLWENMFEGCTNLKYVKLPSALSVGIPVSAFSGCSSLEDIIIPDGTTDIGIYAFSECTGLKTITVPKTVKTIGNNAFKNCSPEVINFIGTPEEWNAIVIASSGNEGLLNAEVRYYSDTESVTLNNSEVDIITGKTYTLTATILPADSYEKTVKWYSSDESVAIVNDGIVTAIAPGTAVITAETEYSGCKATCTVTVADAIAVKSVTMKKKSLTMKSGAVESLSAEVRPFDAKNPNVLWHSDNEEVVSVESVSGGLNFNDSYILKGAKLTAKKAGTAVITVITEDGGYTDTCKVTVLPSEVSGVELDRKELSIYIGENDTLSASVKPDDATNKNVIWKSDNENVVTVTDGILHAVGVGTATVTVTTEEGQFSDSCEVTVRPIDVTGIEIDKSELSILKGQTASIIAAVLPENATDKTVIWSSENESIATVKDGVITGISHGTTVITAKTADNKFSKSCTVTVIDEEKLYRICFEPEELELECGQQGTIVVHGIAENNEDYDKVIINVQTDSGDTIQLKKIIYGDVNNDGVVDSLDSEWIIQCHIYQWEIDERTFLAGDLNGDGHITFMDSVYIDEGKHTELKYKAAYEVKGINAGTANIIARIEGTTVEKSCKVTVVTVDVTGLETDKTELNMVKGQTATINATVLPENATDKKVIWTSGDENVATVNDDGIVTAKGAGTTVIVARTNDGNFTKYCVVKVSEASIPATEIYLDKSTLTLKEGSSETISATVMPEDATNKNVLWSSNDESIATVENGIVTGLKVGTAVIIAKTEDGNHTKYCVVNVTEANVPAVGVLLSKNSVSLVEGGSDSLTATVKPDNATNKNVIWSSNNEAVATVENGMVTAVSPGTAVIIVSTEDGGYIATCIVTVSSINQEVVSAPVANVLSGTVKENTSVILLSATKNANIYYTIDGTVPTTESLKYTSPIIIESDTRVKAIAVKEGMKDSNISTFKYILADPGVPYINVVTNAVGNKGELTTVSVNASANFSISGGKVDLAYDTSVVELVSVTAGNLIKYTNPTINDKYKGDKIRVVWAGATGIDSEGEILKVQFRILDTDSEVTYFNLETAQLSDEAGKKVIAEIGDGALVIGEALPTATAHEYSTESIINPDKKSINVNVFSNSIQNGVLIVTEYDIFGKLSQIKYLDIENIDREYTVLFDKKISDEGKIRVFVWNSRKMMLPLSEVEEIQLSL